MSPAFLAAFALLIDHEKGFTDDPRDRGNWTPDGVLRGTKYGISARQYPHLDIRNLTLEEARAVYLADYWNRVRADDLPPRLAFLAFDAAVNNGVPAASRWLQAAVGADPDGIVGPGTVQRAREAVARWGETEVCGLFQARRIVGMAAMKDWAVFANGWAKRLALLMWQARTFPA